MPTAAEHRAEASALSDTLDAVRAIRLDVLRDDDIGIRGGAATVVRGSIEASVSQLDLLGALITSVVDELHRRAALCDQYTAEVTRYEHARSRWVDAVHRYHASADSDRPAPWPGAAPVPPVRPFPWAAAG